jgi:uncharacterized protein YjbI with pentapeptide repeats
MISGTTSTLDAATVLAAARAAKAAEHRAAADVLEQVIEWARLHEVTEVDQAATWWAGRGQDTGIPLAGEGAPLVSEFAVAELATALGLSAGSGRNLVAQALELAHRLPRLWARVRSGTLAPWRARRIAEETLALPLAGAAWVDTQVAPYAHRTGLAQTQRTVEEAIARFAPELAAERRERAAEGRYFTIDHDQVSFTGTSRVHGELDLADALELEDAIATGAAQLAALGSEESLDVRRSLAIGALARGQQPLTYEPGAEGGVEARPARTSTTGPATGAIIGAKREVVLYVHLSEDALRTRDPDTPVWVENAGGQLLTAAQIADWCRRPDTTKVTVKPVIDLNTRQAVDSYEVPARIAEAVRLRDKTCVFPYCQRPARRCDLDHLDPYLPADQGGPPAQTSTDNLACLCRLHHRMKTHGGWNYATVTPGVYRWRGPHGHTWLRDHTGTTDLTPPSTHPPTRHTDEPADPHPAGHRPAGAVACPGRGIADVGEPCKSHGVSEEYDESVFTDEDWYARDLADAVFRECTFRNVDLTESSSRGAQFLGCRFDNCRLNASSHHGSAFVGCDFRGTSFFDATLDGCKLDGSLFVDCTLRPLAVSGGQWRGITTRGARLRKLTLDGVVLVEADLSDADLGEASLRRCDLSRATLRGADLRGADPRGASLDAVDLELAAFGGTHLDLGGAMALAERHGAVVD